MLSYFSARINANYNFSKSIRLGDFRWKNARVLYHRDCMFLGFYLSMPTPNTPGSVLFRFLSGIHPPRNGLGLGRCHGPTKHPHFVLSPDFEFLSNPADQIFLENCLAASQSLACPVKHPSPELRQVFPIIDSNREVAAYSKWLLCTNLFPNPAPQRRKRLAMASKRTSRGF